MANLYRYGDFTNLINARPSNYNHVLATPTKLQECACIVPNCNMLSRRYSNLDWPSRYSAILVAAVGYYRKKGLTPFFLNHESAADAALITAINLQLPQPLEIVVEVDPLRLKGIIRNAGAVLCSRYHGCVSAMSQGIACIGTSWSHKYDALYTDYGAEPLLLSPNVSVDQLHQAIDTSLDPGNGLRQHLDLRSAALKADSELM